MSINARFEHDRHSDPRGADRRTLRLGATGRIGGEPAAAVTVHNLSATGLLIETPSVLNEGDRFAVELPEAGLCEAEVVWAEAPHYGCRFAEPLDPAALAGAQLRADAASPASEAPAEEAFGDRLRRLRRERGLSMGEVAARLGVSKPTVWAWEHGKSRPVDRRLAGLAEILGVTAGGLGPAPSATPQVLEDSRRRIADAYGVELSRVRIMIEL